MAAEAKQPMKSIEQVTASPGSGLVGDRYEAGRGSFSQPDNRDREVTFIEIEAIEAVNQEYDLNVAASDTRRNLVTQAVPLNHLVGREFSVGDVRFVGIRLCEPCRHLEQLTCMGINKALTHRGGLRAQVLSPGFVRTGDLVHPD